MSLPSQGQEKNTTTTDIKSYIPWVKRNGFSHGAMALLWIFTAFLLFVIFTNVLGPILVLSREGVDLNSLDATSFMNMMLDNADLLLIANSLGQILFLGLATWFFCRLHASKSRRPFFLRFRFYGNTTKMLGMAFVLILTVQPLIWFLGWLNSFVPVPETIESMQMQQMEMIQSYLTSDGMVVVALFNIALVPAICEEILFRGFVLRSFEKSWGIISAIIISGIIFGAYHLQPSSVFPLASIGILLAFLTWVSQSIYPAMIAHFVNNGANVLVAKFYPETAFSELSPETMPPLWLVAVSVVVSGYLIYLLLNDRINESVNLKGEANATKSQTRRY